MKKMLRSLLSMVLVTSMILSMMLVSGLTFAVSALTQPLTGNEAFTAGGVTNGYVITPDAQGMGFTVTDGPGLLRSGKAGVFSAQNAQKLKYFVMEVETIKGEWRIENLTGDGWSSPNETFVCEVNGTNMEGILWIKSNTEFHVKQMYFSDLAPDSLETRVPLHTWTFFDFNSAQISASGVDNLGVTLAKPWTDTTGYTYWMISAEQIEQTPYLVVDLPENFRSALGARCDISADRYVGAPVRYLDVAAKQVVDLRKLLTGTALYLNFTFVDTFVFDALYLTNTLETGTMPIEQAAVQILGGSVYTATENGISIPAGNYAYFGLNELLVSYYPYLYYKLSAPLSPAPGMWVVGSDWATNGLYAELEYNTSEMQCIDLRTLSGMYGDDNSLLYLSFYPANGAELEVLYLSTSGVPTENYLAFETNGGTAIPTDFVAINGQLPTPTKAAHQFAGWYADEELTVPFDSHTIVTKPTTLYAKWIKADVIHPYELPSYEANVQSGFEWRDFGLWVDADTQLAFCINEALLTEYPYLYYKFREVPIIGLGNFGCADLWSWYGYYKQAQSPLDCDDTDLHCVDLRELACWQNTDVDGINYMAFYLWASSALDLEVFMLSKDDQYGYTADYSVSFDTNGGTFVNSQMVALGGLLADVTTTKVGYDFLGWFTDVDCTVPFDLSTPVTKDMTLHAKWEKQNFSVIFMVDGELHTSQRIPYGELVETVSDPTKVGYTFAGWYTEGDVFFDIDTACVTNDITLHAKWNKNDYTVNFVTNGGTAVDSQNVAYGEFAENVTPTKVGYDFHGWFTDADCTAAFDFATPVTANVTLYAKWEKQNFPVIFMVDGEVYTSQLIPYGELVETVSDPTKVGYTFAGWYTDADCTVAFDFDTPATGLVTLYAKFAQNVYTVDFVVDGGAWKSQTVTHGECAENVTPTKVGYDFAGWYTDADCTVAFDFDTPVTANVTLYAKFERNVYTVDFVVDGEVVQSQNVPHGDFVAQLAPTKQGFIFTGWYTDADCTVAFDPANTAITQSMTLYAGWKDAAIHMMDAVKDAPLLGAANKVGLGLAVDSNGFAYLSIPKSLVDQHPYLHYKLKIVPNNVSWFHMGNIWEANTTALDYSDTAMHCVDLRTLDCYAGEYLVLHLSAVSSIEFEVCVLSAEENYAYTADYTVDFVTNGGTAVDSQTVALGGLLADVTTTKAGHTFAGWFTDADCTVAFDFDTPVTANVTLYAKFERNVYTVDFVVDGEVVQSQNVPHGDFVAQLAPTKVGYDFAGWYTDADCTAAFDFDTPVTANVTLYAKWEKQKFPVIFKVDDVVYTSQLIPYGELVETVSDPTKVGYTFAGWYTDADCTVAFDFDTPATEPVTLYAKFEQNVYTVDFVVDGGAWKSQTVTHGDFVAQLAPTKQGFIFTGWYTDADCTVAFDPANTAITQSMTLYAGWKDAAIHMMDAVKDAPVLGAANKVGLGLAVDSNGFAYLSIPKSLVDQYPYLYYKLKIVPNNVSWFHMGNIWEANTTALDYSDTAMHCVDLRTLDCYAGEYVVLHLSAVSSIEFEVCVLSAEENYAYTADYTVNFVTNGGTAVDSQTVALGGLLADVTTTKAGHTFAGWFTDADCTAAFDFDTPVTANITLHAKWNKNDYTVNFVTNGGTAVDSQNVAYGEFAENVTPTKVGYDFLGWFTDVDCTAAFDFDTPVTANVTLYAKFERKVYTVDFVVDGEVVQSQNVPHGDFAAQLAPTKQSYLFAGWYTDADCTVAFDPANTAITQSMTLYAGWKPTTIHVLDGAEAVTNDVDRTDLGFKLGGEEYLYLGISEATIAEYPYLYIKLKNIPPMGTGDWFALGEYWGLEGVNFVENMQPLNCATTALQRIDLREVEFYNNGDQTAWICLYLYCSGLEGFDFEVCVLSAEENYAYTADYTVDFVVDDHVWKSQSVAYNAAAAKLYPVKTAHTFAGWYTDEELTQRFDFSTPVTNDITLYAKWNQAVQAQIVHLADAATVTLEKPAEESGTVTQKTTLGLSVPFDHYAYYAIPESTVAEYPYLYLKLKEVPTDAPIRYSVGNYWGHEKWEEDLTELKYSTAEMQCIDLRTLEQYYGNGDGLISLIFYANNPSIELDVCVLSKRDDYEYDPNPVVEFVTNCDQTVDAQTVEAGATLDEITPPTKEGYDFAGWYTDVAYVVPFDTDNTAVFSSMTLYAKWEIAADNRTSPVYAQLQKGVTSESATANIRFVMAIDKAQLSQLRSVGFVISTKDSTPTAGEANCKEYATDTVYTSIYADDVRVTAAQLGGDYICALTLRNIPNKNFETPIYVTTIARAKDGTVYTSPVKVYTVEGMMVVQ